MAQLLKVRRTLVAEYEVPLEDYCGWTLEEAVAYEKAGEDIDVSVYFDNLTAETVEVEVVDE